VRVEFEYEIRRGDPLAGGAGELLAEAATVLASIDAAGKPRRLQPEFRAALERCLE
jgi:acyl-CoA thioesterase FadM